MKSKTSYELYDETFFPAQRKCKLREELKKSCEGELTRNESLQTLKSMVNNKTPGSVGFPGEFYRFF